MSPATKYNRGFSQSGRTKPAPLFTQTITPADSSEEESSPPFFASQSRLRSPASLSTGSTLNSVEQRLELDMDMDMMESQPLASPRYLGQTSLAPSPKASPCTVNTPLPAFRDPFKDQQTSASGGRLPTPIYGHFQQSIDAKMDTGEDQGSIIPRTQQEIEYDQYVRRRRLPTPIDEDEVMGSSIISDRLVLDTEHHHRLSTVKARDGSGPPARNTRLSFSMGVRADCELCRMRVPGHSNHIFKG